MLKDPDKRYLRELAKAIIDHEKSPQAKEEVEFLFELSKKMMIDPFKDFVPDMKFESEYDVLGWVKDGYSKPLRKYKNKDKVLIDLKCRNPITVSETIRKDKENNRTDCFHFFRYMNSGLMRRYIHSEEFDVTEDAPWEPFRREHRTIDTSPKTAEG